jgi:hypothetical protein
MKSLLKEDDAETLSWAPSRVDSSPVSKELCFSKEKRDNIIDLTQSFSDDGNDNDNDDDHYDNDDDHDDVVIVDDEDEDNDDDGDDDGNPGHHIKASNESKGRNQSSCSFRLDVNVAGESKSYFHSTSSMCPQDHQHRRKLPSTTLCKIDEDVAHADFLSMPPPLPQFPFSHWQEVQHPALGFSAAARTTGKRLRSSSIMSSSLSVPSKANNSFPSTSSPFVLDYKPTSHQDREASQTASSSSLITTTSHPGSQVRTSAITLLDTHHGRQRRQERVIAIREIQSAMKYGKKFLHPCNPNLLIYEYQGKRHIVTKNDHRLVTTMGIRINPRPKFISEQERRNHYRHMNHIRGTGFFNHRSNECQNDWSSHSILIVDKSGSMRNSDVHGCRTRLGAVWLSIAQDFIRLFAQFYEHTPMCVAKAVNLEIKFFFVITHYCFH